MLEMLFQIEFYSKISNTLYDSFYQGFIVTLRQSNSIQKQVDSTRVYCIKFESSIIRTLFDEFISVPLQDVFYS